MPFDIGVESGVSEIGFQGFGFQTVNVPSATNLDTLLAESIDARRTATQEQIDASEEFQEFFGVFYSILSYLVGSKPDITDTERRSIAKEIAETIRPGDTVAKAVARWIPNTWEDNLCRDDDGKLSPVPINAYILLKCHPDVRGSIRFNTFSKAIEICGGPLAGRSNLDDIVTTAQDWLHNAERYSLKFADIARRLVLVAQENEYDPIVEYLDGLRWDGVKRIGVNGGWLTKYVGADDADIDYVAEVSQKWLVAAVSRGYEPGSKTDVVMVLEGLQGARKSSILHALGGEWFADSAIVIGNKDSQLLAASAWIVELPDMASLKKSEQNAMKAFFSTRFDSFRMPYGRSIVKSPRRCVFATSTNDQEYLSDPTGSRRFWPIHCTFIDVLGVLRDRDQLWAEAVHIYRQAATCTACAASTDVVWGQKPRCHDHSWWLSPRMSKQLVKESESREEEQDVWTQHVLEFAENPKRRTSDGVMSKEVRADLTTANCLIYGVGKPIEQCTHNDKMRVGKILRHAGYRTSKLYSGVRVYTKDPLKTSPQAIQTPKILAKSGPDSNDVWNNLLKESE